MAILIVAVFPSRLSRYNPSCKTAAAVRMLVPVVVKNLLARAA
jgi:hypothetical protein